LADGGFTRPVEELRKAPLLKLGQDGSLAYARPQEADDIRREQRRLAARALREGQEKKDGEDPPRDRARPGAAMALIHGSLTLAVDRAQYL
ncbi:MAG TPA: hypothetical protein VN083_11155, partial [Vicinamibacteria bacterium]|nr:hypothetical protein [Vicinamibacteria bacterium]